MTGVASSEITSIVPFEVVFPDDSAEFTAFCNLVSSLSLTDALFWCGRLNLVLTNPHLTNQEAQTYFAFRFLDAQECQRAERYQQSTPESSGTFVQRAHLLELVRWVVLLCTDQPGDGRTFEDPEVRRTFAKALLVAAKVWLERVHSPYLRPEPTSLRELEEARKRILGSERLSIEASQTALTLSAALGRGYQMFANLMATQDSRFAPAFETATGMSLEDYYVAHATVSAAFEDLPERLRLRKDQLLFNLSEFDTIPAIKERVEKLLRVEAQTAQELRQALWPGVEPGEIPFRSFAEVPSINDLPVRKKPLLKTDDGRVVILEGGFLKDRMTVGPYFYYFQSATNGKVDRQMASFGKAFERYVGDGLRFMFPVGAGLAERLTTNVKTLGGKGEIELYDACLNNGQSVILFEVTAKFIRDDTVLALDPAAPTFPGEVWKKYEDKLRQLVDGIEKAIVANYQNEFSHCKLVYPVLLVYDRRLATKLVGHMLNVKFQDVLQGEPLLTGHVRKNGLDVAPLTLMTIDDFELLETSTRYFALEALLADYTKAVPDRMTTLHNFIAMTEPYHSQLRGSVRLERYKAALGKKIMALIPTDVQEALKTTA
jgi:hypothetical protein